jgi:hypothetical protein
MFLFGSRAWASLDGMPDAQGRLAPATPEDLADALAFALRFDGRKRKHDATEIMARIVATRLVEHLEQSCFVVMKRPPIGRSAPRGTTEAWQIDDTDALQAAQWDQATRSRYGDSAFDRLHLQCKGGDNFEAPHMSLSGQWVARYAGTNSGTLVIELDEIGDHYEGTACAWQDEPDSVSSLIRIHTLSKDNNQRLEGIRVQPMYYNGTFIPPVELEQLKSTRGLLFPETVDIELGFDGQNLSIKWKTPVGSAGGGTAIAPKTRDGLTSELMPLPVRTWDEFKTYVNSLERKRYIFRGQENNEWRLRTSFYRTGRACIERYLINDVNDLHRTLSSLTRIPFDLDNRLQYAAFINLVQHHGYPTPFLDWTWSPYVAAFFAFRNIEKDAQNAGGRKVRIFKFDSREWNRRTWRADKLFPIRPNVSVVDALAIENSRAIPQQSISTVSNVDDIETVVRVNENSAGATYLEIVDLPAGERNQVMEELALMGITAGSLFPGLDGACESLRERNF